MKRVTKFDNLTESGLNKGLIASYDTQKLKSTLEKKFGKNVYIKLPSENEKNETLYGLNYHTYSFMVILTNLQIDVKNFVQKLSKTLSLFGYFINKDDKKTDYIIYQIEPKFPIKVNSLLQQNHIQYLYHLTPTKNVKKIQKIGLTPRISKTGFEHIGNRIYLVNGSKEKMITLFQELADHKDLTLQEFTLFKTLYNSKYTYYIDDMATVQMNKLIAVFILQNIPPNELEIVQL